MSPNDRDSSERWPTAGDRLFVERAWAYDARVVRDPGERFYRMPMGYKRAGDLLIHQAAVDVVDRSNVIYAALFCYRQSIELFLKQIIDEFADEAVKKRCRTHHDLAGLWLEFMVIVDERSTRDALSLDVAASLVAELHDADERSDGFRYATTRKGQPFAFGDVGIDLDNLRGVVDGLVNFFECSYLAFTHDGHESFGEWGP